MVTWMDCKYKVRLPLLSVGFCLSLIILFIIFFNQLKYFFYFSLFYIPLLEFKSITKEICKLPSFFSTALFRKIDVEGTGIVTRYVVSVWISALLNFLWLLIAFAINFVTLNEFMWSRTMSCTPADREGCCKIMLLIERAVAKLCCQ